MTKSHRNTACSKTKGQKKEKSSRLLLLSKKGQMPDPNDKEITENNPKRDTKVLSKATLPANEKPPKGNISVNDEAVYDNASMSEGDTEVPSKATSPANENPTEGTLLITDKALQNNETTFEMNISEQYIPDIVIKSKATSKSVLTNNPDKEFCEPGKMTFLIHKHLHNSGQLKKEYDYPDNETENASSPKLYIEFV